MQTQVYKHVFLKRYVNVSVNICTNVCLKFGNHVPENVSMWVLKLLEWWGTFVFSQGSMVCIQLFNERKIVFFFSSYAICLNKSRGKNRTFDFKLMTWRINKIYLFFAAYILCICIELDNSSSMAAAEMYKIMIKRKRKEKY